MRNERGDTLLFCTVGLCLMASLLLLCSLELQKSFSLLKKRTDLFLCLKETKGEIHDYLKFMGRTNWAIKNTERASLLMMIIPGLQGAAMNAKKLKKILQSAQETERFLYLKKLFLIKQKGCPLDPRMLKTPFQMSGLSYLRNSKGTTILREKQWSYQFLTLPYAIRLDIRSQRAEDLKPQILYKTRENMERLSFLLQ